MQDVSISEHIHQHEDKTVDFVVRDKAGVVVNVTGWTMSWMVKKNPLDADGAAMISLTVGSGITIVDGPAGLVRVSFATGTTPYVGWHALKRTGSGTRTVLAQGPFEVRWSVIGA